MRVSIIFGVFMKKNFFTGKNLQKCIFLLLFFVPFLSYSQGESMLVSSKERLFNIIILLGPPGSGKGSQAVWIAEKLGIKHLSTGDLFRDAAKTDPILSDTLKQGGLVSDQQVCGLVETELKKLKNTPGVLLDGFPRSLQQAEWLDSVAAQSKITVLLLDTPDDLLFSRVTQRFSCSVCKKTYNTQTAPPLPGNYCSCGHKLTQRADDQDMAVFKRRVQDYHEITRPLISYYKKDKKLVVIDGSRSIKQVKEEIEQKLFK